MSFLNSIISTIDGPGSKNGVGETVTPTSPAPGVTKSLGPSTTQRSASRDATKRKLPDSDSAQASKVGKPGSAAVSAASHSRSATSSPVPRPVVAAQKSQSSSSAAPRPAVKPGIQRPMSSHGQDTGSASTLSSSKPQVKKGGYLAMLERAKAQQETNKPGGQIKHHKVEKVRLSRRARERLAAEGRAGFKKAGTTAGEGPLDGNKSRMAGTNKVETPKSKTETSYKGTMRGPAREQPAYRGTMGGSRDMAKAGPSNPKNGARTNGTSRYRYADDDDEVEDDEDDDMNDYASASSDMEAGLDDIDEEELLSSKVARKEDEEALRQENELKRIKLERKRKLEALSSAAAAKRKVY